MIFFLLFISDKYVIENQIIFTQAAEMHIHKNGELDYSYFKKLGPVVQNIVSLTSVLMTNTLTVVAKVFSNTLKNWKNIGPLNFYSDSTYKILRSYPYAK